MNQKKKKVADALEGLFSGGRAPEKKQAKGEAQEAPLIKPVKNKPPSEAKKTQPGKLETKQAVPTPAKQERTTRAAPDNVQAPVEVHGEVAPSPQSPVPVVEKEPSQSPKAELPQPIPVKPVLPVEVDRASTPPAEKADPVGGNGHHPANGAGEVTQMVVFDLAGEKFGIPIAKVESIIKNQVITEVPRALPYVVGVTNLRGTVLPIFDLRKRFGLPAGEETDDQRIVVVFIHEEKVGLRVDAVSQVLRLPNSAIEPPPAMVAANFHSGFISGIAKVENDLVMLLDLEKVLEHSGASS